MAPDGSVWPLSSPELGWATLDDVTGLGPAPVDLVTDPHPRGGERVRHVQPLARVVTWPLAVWGDSHLQFLARWRALSRAFALTRRLGPGRLQITRPDGSRREILVYFQNGFEGVPGMGYTDDVAVISLLCEDPYFRAVDPLAVTFGTGASRPFLNPFPSLSSGRVLGDVKVTNPGEVEAWPEWTLTGPFSSFVAFNRTLGQTFVLNYPLASGQRVTISTDPPTVRGPAGQPLTYALQWPGSVLWHLEPGTNDVQFTAHDAEPGASVVLEYRPRFETA
ncbi:phage tail domain-containing protein [Micromonospora sp. M71_S20]|uniref:phage distal tail protein n=1 Tax=Micromonospora sp. M71_S20 TaxID=592872 RepID=UPI0018F5BC0D|nr:phage tail domain-containing protein [Micromonospora sp. M71_S20]